MAIGKPCKNALYCAFGCSYLKNEVGDPIFVINKSDHQAKKKFSVKFQKILCSRFRATLNFQLFKVALNRQHRTFLNFAESFFSGMLITFQKLKMGVTEFGFEI